MNPSANNPIYPQVKTARLRHTIRVPPGVGNRLCFLRFARIPSVTILLPNRYQRQTITTTPFLLSKSRGDIMIRAGRFFLLLSICLFTVGASGQTSVAGAASVSPSANQVAAAQSFDVKAAVDAYLAKMPPADEPGPMPISRVATGCFCGTLLSR